MLGAPYLATGFAEHPQGGDLALFEEWVVKLSTPVGAPGPRRSTGSRASGTCSPTRPYEAGGSRGRAHAHAGLTGVARTMSAMGATPTPMPYAEVYSALELKAIDAVEVQFRPVQLQALRAAKYVTKTGHISLITGLVTSRKWYDSLPADLQKMLREEALQAGDIASYGTRDWLAKYEASSGRRA